MVTGQGEAKRGEKMGEAKERRTAETDEEGKRKCEIHRRVIGRREQGMADKE
jgi:hypothetical protein